MRKFFPAPWLVDEIWIAYAYFIFGINKSLKGTLEQPAITATITPKALAITGLKAADKTYDGTAAATLDTAAVSLSGLVGGQTLGLTVGAAVFVDKNVGANKVVSATSVALANGTGVASNYTASQPTGVTGSITPKALSVSGITAARKLYDGTTAATVSTTGAVLTGLVAGDAVTVGVTGAFADKNVGVAKTVFLTSTKGGADAGNYTMADQVSATAAITPKAVTVSGLGVADKTADGTTAAAIATPGTLAALVANDNVKLDATTATAQFAQPAPGTGIPVSVTGLVLSGTDAGNYVIPASSASTGTILPAPRSASLPATAAAAVIASQAGGIASSIATPAVGGLAYVAVADGATTPQAGEGKAGPGSEVGPKAAPASATQRRQSSSQGAGANRDVKYLDVMVVSGGIRMPVDTTADTGPPGAKLTPGHSQRT